MRFCKQRRESYCGINLHANSKYVCVVDHAGKKVHKNFGTNMPETIFPTLRPFCKRDLIIGRESNFSRNRFADLCTASQITRLLIPNVTPGVEASHTF